MLCSLVFLCCLDFGVWSLDHRVKFFSFHFTFSSPFFTLTLFFFFFPFYFFPLNLMSCYFASQPRSTISRPCPATSSCYLPALLCLVLPRHLPMPCTTSNYYPVISSYYLNLLPCHLVVLHATLNCRATSNYRTIELPNHLKLPFITSALLPHCLYLLLPFATSLPQTTSHYLYLVISLPLALVAFCYLITSSCLTLLHYLPTSQYFIAWLPLHLK